MQRLATLDGLTPSLTEPEAIATLTTLTVHESWMELHRQAGLTWDDAERTILFLVRTTLLAGSPETRP